MQDTENKTVEAIPNEATDDDIDALLKQYAEEESQSTQSLNCSDDSMDIDEVYETSSQKTTLLGNPFIKGFGSIGLVSFVLIGGFGLVKGCEGSKGQVAKDKPLTQEQQQIADLSQRLKVSEGEKEMLIAKSQLQNYGKDITKKPKADPKAAQLAALQKMQAAQRAQNIERTSYRPSINSSEPPRAYRSMTPSIPKQSAPPPRDLANEKIIASLQAELEQMRQQLKKPAETAPIVTEPVAELQNVAMEAPASEVNGGWQEDALMSGQTPVMIPVGSEVEAILNTPILGSASKVVMTLSTSLKAADGQVALPEGTRLLGSATMEGSVVNIQVQAATSNGQSLNIPPEFSNAIAVMKSNNKPLLAKDFNKKSGFGSFLTGALVGAGTGFVQQLVTPQTTTSFATNGIASQTSTSLPNTLGNAGLQAANRFAQDFGQGIQQQISSGNQSTGVAMGVAAGTKIKMIFANDVPLLAASALPTDVHPQQPSAISQEDTSSIPVEQPMPEEGLPDYQHHDLNGQEFPQDSGQFLYSPDEVS
ncbi:MAG: hypothetical protein ACRCYP_01730 [Alphaproteobacteria bacterium]